MSFAPVPGFSNSAFSTYLLTGIPFSAASHNVPAGPAGKTLRVQVDVPDFGAWMARNTNAGAHFAINLLDNKAVAPFATGPTGSRGPGYQWGSISTGVGAAVGRAAGPNAGVYLEQFRKAVGQTVLLPGTEHLWGAIPTAVRVVVQARVLSNKSAFVSYELRHPATNALLLGPINADVLDYTPEFGLGVSLIVVGTNKPDGSVDRPTFSNVQYDWI